MTKRMVKADFVTGFLLIVLGVATVGASLAMPRFAELNVEPYTAPGLVPGALGVVLLVLGGTLFVRAARAGGWRLLERAGERSSWSAPGVRNLALAALLCLAYAAGLVGRAPFWLATFLFVAAFVLAFEWPFARTHGERVRRVAFAVIFAAVVAAAVTLVFQEIFLVRLP